MNYTVTLPNGAAGRCRRHIRAMGAAALRELVGELSVGIERSTRGIDGVQPVMYVVQRHFTSQRAKRIEDARLSFDLRAALPTRRERIRLQLEWIQTVPQAIDSKQSSLQVGIGAEIRYDSDFVRLRQILDQVAAIWIAPRPWMERGLGLAPGSPSRE